MALTNTVMQVPGGEFVKNAKIYRVGKEYWAVVGDVWGYPIPETKDITGYAIGEKVRWHKKLATVVAIKMQLRF